MVVAEREVIERGDAREKAWPLRRTVDDGASSQDVRRYPSRSSACVADRTSSRCNVIAARSSSVSRTAPLIASQGSRLARVSTTSSSSSQPELGDARTGVRAELDEALARELLERDPHRRHADAELCGELPVAQPLAGREPPVEDRAPQLPRDDLLDGSLLGDASDTRNIGVGSDNFGSGVVSRGHGAKYPRSPRSLREPRRRARAPRLRSHPRSLRRAGACFARSGRAGCRRRPRR